MKSAPKQVGTIAQVHGPVVDIACAVLPALQQALVSKLDDQTYTFEVHQHLDEKHVRAITLHRSAGLRRGMPVFDTGSSLHVPVSPECLGRLVDVFGEPLDGGPVLGEEVYRNILAKPGPLHEARAATGILETGGSEQRISNRSTARECRGSRFLRDPQAPTSL